MTWDRQTAIVGALLAVLLTMSILHAVAGYAHTSGHAYGTDDAYISYRYARNLVAGHGLVFNPGERVEGYSNFAYVLLMVPVFLFTETRAYPWSVAINLLCIAGAFGLLHRHVRKACGTMAANMAGCLFVACPPLWLWVASGMETALVVVLTLAVWTTVEEVADTGAPRAQAWLCVAMACLVLARADGFIIPGAAIVYLLVRGRYAAAWRGAVLLAVLLSLYFTWRYIYYGYPLPNTYYAKVSGPLVERVAHAHAQLARLILHDGLLPVFLALAYSGALAVYRRVRTGAFPPCFAAWSAVVGIGYWIYIGGDHFNERFLIVLIPLGIAELMRLLTPLQWTRGVAFTLGLVVLLPLGSLGLDPRFAYTLAKYDRWTVLGSFLAVHHSGATLAIDAAGKAPFFSQLPTIDMLGLTDEHIAHLPTTYFAAGHNKTDARYVLRRRPDLIAAWLDQGRDLAWGMTEALYAPAGYRLRYLVNAARRSAVIPTDNIADVRTADAGTVTRLIDSGYTYAVLERVAQEVKSAP